MFRRAKKTFNIISIILLSCVALWFVANMIDRSETDLVKKYYYDQKTVQLEENGYIYLIGFNAPEKVSPIKLGQKLYDDFSTINPDVDDVFNILDQYLEEKNIKLLRFQGNNNWVCWYNQKAADNAIETECPDEKELIDTINKNKLLIKRLKELSAYKHFDIDFLSPSTFKTEDFINLQRLINAHFIYLKQQGKTQEAISLWLQNLELLNNLLSSRLTFVDKAITLISIEDTQSVILELTRGYNLSDIELKNIESTLLRPAFGENGFNILKTQQAEFNYLLRPLENFYKNNKPLFRPYLINDTRNQHAKITDDFLTLTNSTAEDIEENIKAYRKEQGQKQDSQWHLSQRMLYNSIGHLFVDGLRKGEELFRKRYVSTIYSRMIFLIVKARAEHISPSEFGDFVQNAPDELKNPMTGQPFDWNGKELSFTHSDYPGWNRQYAY